MTDPLISIIIPCYDHGRYIDEAIKSVEVHEKDNYEIIIVNDGSSDDFTNKRLLDLQDEGYHVILQENQGLGKTRNNGIRIAKGKYILPLDADNKIKAEFIDKALEILENNPQISIVYSDRQNFGIEEHVVIVEEFSLTKILIENYIDACAVYRKSMWEHIGGYDENMPVQGYEDWDFWLSAAEKGYSFYYIPKPLFYYRVVENSMIRKLTNSRQYDEVVEYIYLKHIFINNKSDLWLKTIFANNNNNKIDTNMSLHFSEQAIFKIRYFNNFEKAQKVIGLIKKYKLDLKYLRKIWYYYLKANPLINRHNLIFSLLLLKKFHMPEPFKSMKIFHTT